MQKDGCTQPHLQPNIPDDRLRDWHSSYLGTTFPQLNRKRLQLSLLSSCVAKGSEPWFSTILQNWNCKMHCQVSDGTSLHSTNLGMTGLHNHYPDGQRWTSCSYHTPEILQRHLAQRAILHCHVERLQPRRLAQRTQQISQEMSSEYIRTDHYIESWGVRYWPYYEKCKFRCPTTTNVTQGIKYKYVLWLESSIKK